MGLTGQMLTTAADVGWALFQSVNTRLPEGRPFRPEWAPAPLLKSYERTRPPLGYTGARGIPRE